MGSLTGYVIGVMFDPSAPTVPVGNQPFLVLPLSGTGILTFTGLNNQNYIFREFISTDTNYLHGTQIGSDVQVDASLAGIGQNRGDLWITYTGASGSSVIQGGASSIITSFNMNGITTSNTDNYKLYYTLSWSGNIPTLNIYKDSAKTELVLSGTIGSLSGTTIYLTLNEENSSGLYAIFDITLNTTNASGIITIPESQIVGSQYVYNIFSGTQLWTNTSYSDTSLGGWVYWIEQRGVGSLQPGVDINYLSSGGLQFINGYIIQNGDEFVIHFQPQITSQTSQNSSNPAGSLYLIDSINNPITANKILSPSDMGKIWIITSSTGGTINITLPNPSSCADGVQTVFISEGGLHIMAAIIPTTSIQYCNQTISQSGIYKAFYLAQGESVTIFKIGLLWFVNTDNSAFKTVGTIFESMNRNEMNALLLDGSLYPCNSYPRLYEYMLRLEGNDIPAPDSDWNKLDTVNLYYPYVGSFGFTSGDSNFRLPLIMYSVDSLNRIVSSGFTRAIGTPSSSIAGITGIQIGDNRTGSGYSWWDKVGNFVANLTGVTIWKSGANNSIIALGIPTSGSVSPDANKTEAGNNVVQNVPFVTKPYNTSNTTLNIETAPANTSVYKFIRY